jgi:multisubunit Na+/H+ antiporter MnhB subunit
MNGGAQFVAAARFYAPMIAFFALTLLAARSPGGGIGFTTGLSFGLALALHALVFGGHASRRAFPPMFARTVLSLGALGAFAAPTLRIVEACLFVTTASAAALILTVLIGRAPTLRDVG